MRKLKIIGTEVFLEKRKTRCYVGVLKRIEEKIVFRYDDHYFRAKHIIPLGPEFPLTQQQFVSDQLFPSLQDRIPSRQNPAYAEYCQWQGIDPKETDPFILLSTIGRRGPSSFIFSPLFERDVRPEDLVKFRKALRLTTREFANIFEFSQPALNALERGRTSGKDLLKRLEILLNFADVALHFLILNRGYLIHDRWQAAVDLLKSREKAQRGDKEKEDSLEKAVNR